MKKYILSVFASTLLFASCSIEETNFKQLDPSIAYNSIEGYNGLINACYENNFYLYGKVDGIPLMEMGTDLWKNGSRNGGHGELTNYNEGLNSDVGTINVVWRALYCTVGYCNTAIYFKDKSTQFTEEEIAPKLAEAYFLRGFSNFHIVEQWGNCVLNTVSMAQPDVNVESAYRSSEEDFYNLIISDLKFARDNLPVVQGDKGRATKKAALAMLAKAYMQRTRLYPQGSAEEKAYADSAFMTAKELIDNAAQYNCGLYQSTATKSGNAQVWDGNNNKNNKEFLFLESVDEENGKNPEGWNRGRTSQYYMMGISSQAQNFGVATDGIRYGRANATVWMPTLYLLKDCFDSKLPKSETNEELINLAQNPDDRTPDTRFEDAFYYKYYSKAQTIIKKDVLARYKKDTIALAKTSARTIKSSVLKGSDYAKQYPDANIYAAGTLAGTGLEREDVADGLSCYTPNWMLDTLKTAVNKRLAVGLAEMYNMDETGNKYGQEAEHSYFRNVFPSLKKHRNFKYAYTNQYCMQDQPIIRLTDIYLIAAEAAIVGTKGMDAGLPYLNAVRRHAAVSGDAAEMEVTSYDIEYLLKERARELCGEQWRWYDLKRTRHLTQEYLGGKGRNPYITTFSQKHLVRPIPQEFLNQIANPEEFGTNGY